MPEALLWEPLEEGKVKCRLCAHQCVIAEGKRGICQVRENKAGKLYSLVYEKCIAEHVDPIEKKPLYHFCPGSLTFSIATLGCNFKCPFCQNADISQLPFSQKKISGDILTPPTIVSLAQRSQCKSIAYTYTEPTIFFEYALDTAKLAKKEGIKNIFVTNGYMTEEALEEIKPYLDAANVDLKSFREEFYREMCRAHLAPVLDSLRKMKDLGIWVEITTLLIPGLNDSEEELRQIADFILSLGKETPWHISRFYPNYQMLDRSPTPVSAITQAREIGLERGLRYVYSGNVLGDKGENTYCYHCKKLIIGRYGYEIVNYNIFDSKCKFCQTTIDGVNV